MKVEGSTQKPRIEPLSRHCRLFWNPLLVLSDFAIGGRCGITDIALQHCGRCSVSGSELVTLSPLGWYSNILIKMDVLNLQKRLNNFNMSLDLMDKQKTLTDKQKISNGQ